MNENWICQNWFELHPGIQNAIREQLKTFKFSTELQIRILNLIVKNNISEKSESYKLVVNFQDEIQYSVDIFKLQIIEEKSIKEMD